MVAAGTEARPERKLEDAAIGILNSAFPDLSCLRCGNKEFFARVVDDEVIFSLHTAELISASRNDRKFRSDLLDKVAELTCGRCGMIERHRLSILNAAAKPIAVDSNG